MNNQRDVLDLGFVRLVDHMGDDLSIVRAARVSYDADWRLGPDNDKDDKLIGYLLKNKHTSPFEAVVFTFEIKAPIFVLRQWHRHRTWSYNEVSARYTELDEGFYLPAPNVIGQQAASSKQARVLSENYNGAAALGLMTGFFHGAGSLYKKLLELGVPRELARSVLPLASYSRMFATVDLHNLLHFLRLRLHPHAQYEIRVYAEAIAGLIRQVVPVTMRYFAETL